MKLLMVTRKVDPSDELAGFTFGWVSKLASNIDELKVLTWQKSSSEGLPANVKLTSLPAGKLRKIFAFQIYLFKNLKTVDGIFCHMNPEYTILSAFAAKIYKKKIVSWYTHSSVSLRMRLMEKLATQVLTASSKSFRLKSTKLKIVGHGIDSEEFKPAENNQFGSPIRILTVGRISPTKDYDSMIKAVDILNDQSIEVSLEIAGGPGLESQQSYFEGLKGMVSAMKIENKVKFLGPVSHSKIPEILKISDIFINLSGTGSLDKAVLEAMASGCIVLTSNEAFAEMLPSELMVEKNNPKQLAEKIRFVIALDNQSREELQKKLRSIVIESHDLNVLAKKIVNNFR